MTHDTAIQPPRYKVLAARSLLQVAERLGRTDVPEKHRRLAAVRLPGEDKAPPTTSR